MANNGERDWALVDFGIQHGLSESDVEAMLKSGLIKTVDSLAGESLVFCGGLTPQEAIRAYQFTQRLRPAARTEKRFAQM